MEKHLKLFSVKWRSSCPWDHELNVNYLRLHARWSVLEPRPVWFLGLDSLSIRLPRLSLLHPQIHGNKDINGDEIFNPWNATISDDSSSSILQNFFYGMFGSHLQPREFNMKTSWNGNIFHVTGHLCREFTGHQWILRTKASDAEFWWFFFYQHLNKQLSKHWWGWWFETPSRPLWRHCTEISKLTLLSPMYMKMIQYRSVLMHADIPRFCDDHIQGEFGRINNVYRLSLYVIMPHGQYRSHKKAVCVMTWTSLLIPCWMVKNLPFDC